MQTTRAHPRSLVSAFVIHLLESVKYQLATCKILITQLVLVAQQVRLSLTWSQATKAGFLLMRLKWKCIEHRIFIIYDCVLHAVHYLFVINNMGLVATKPVFGVSDKASLASLDVVLSKRQITKALIRLRGCAGWSSRLLFAYL